MRIGVLLVAVAAVVAASTRRVDEAVYRAVVSDKAHADDCSTEPTQELPIDWHLLSQAAGLAQEPYCRGVHIGHRVGDSELIWKKETFYFSQRASIFKSASLGIVLSIEGTDIFALNGFVKDAVSIPVDPAAAFSGILPDGTKLAEGFQSGFLQIEKEVIPALKEQLQKHNETKVAITGHSLGAAIGLLFGVKLDEELEHGVDRVLLFGLPRVGNKRFAEYVDGKLKGRLYYAVNGDDIVAQVPERQRGFQHPSGQIWIEPANSDNWKFCPGQENVHCSRSVRPNPLLVFNHLGTYFHTLIGSAPFPCPPTVGDKGK